MKIFPKIILMLICALPLFRGSAHACMPIPGQTDNTLEEGLNNASIVFEGHLIRYEKYEISTVGYPEFKNIKDKLPIVVKVYAVDKNWKGTTIGQEIKISPPPVIMRLTGLSSDDKKFKLPDMPKTNPISIIVLGPKTDFSTESDVVYQGLSCPSENLGHSPEYLEMLQRQFPQGSLQ